MRKYLVNMLIFGAFLSFTACDDKNAKIVGFWKKDKEQIIYHFESDGKLTEYRLRGEIFSGTYSFSKEKILTLNSPAFNTVSFKNGVKVHYKDDSMYFETLNDYSPNTLFKRLNEDAISSQLKDVRAKNTLRIANIILSDLQKLLHDHRVGNGRYPYKSGQEGWSEFAPKIDKARIDSVCSQIWFFSEGWQYKIALQLRSDTPVYLTTESIHLYTVKVTEKLPAWVSQKKEPMTVLP